MFRLQRDILIGFVIVCAAAIGLMSSNLMRFADFAIYDAQSRWLRINAPTHLTQDVVVIGLDEAAYEAIPEPYALWHRHLGDLLTGLASARPNVVGMATPMPVRSYEFLVKNVDAPLIEGINRIRKVAPIVIGQPLGIANRLRPVAPEIVAAAGIESIASLAICEDTDGVVRRIHQKRCMDETKVEPFSVVMARRLGREGRANGMIDYTAGSEIDYLPIRDVLDWIRQGKQDQLDATFKNRVVVVANLLPTENRHRLPVALAGWERGSRTEPGAVVQVQALRSMLSRGLVARISDTAGFLLAGLGTLIWFGRNSWLKALVLVMTIGGVIGASTFDLWHGNYMHTGTLITGILIAFFARLVWESARHYKEREMLRSAFAGHVSPQVMRAILRGNLQPDADGERCKVTILFADIRGFTTRSSQSTPEAMIDLLNRFYGEAAAAIHGRGGAIDKYIGDGLMATFGVPQPLQSPERNALEAAQDMLVRIERINRQLAAESLPPIEIGIGINTGEVLAGYVGSRRRRDFTVIGDPVNTASRLEGLTKEVGYPVVCSHEIAAAVGFSGGLVDLGDKEIKGRAAVHVWGWNPPLNKRLKPGAGFN